MLIIKYNRGISEILHFKMILAIALYIVNRTQHKKKTFKYPTVLGSGTYPVISTPKHKIFGKMTVDTKLYFARFSVFVRVQGNISKVSLLEDNRYIK